MIPAPLDWSRLRVRPLAERRSLSRLDSILVDPDQTPGAISPAADRAVTACAERVRAARDRGAAVILIYGAHLLRNGAATILDRMMGQGWLTHLATNGAGTIHDWEYSWLGASTESVEDGVAHGRFGTWDETGKFLHMALMGGVLDGLGYGAALGRFIRDDGVTLPGVEALAGAIRADPAHPLTAARADLLRAIETQKWPTGRVVVEHKHPEASILRAASQHQVAMTVHPGVGYDIITNHPAFSGAAIGRAADLDFRLMAGSVDQLDGGVVLSIGSAIMGPQVFEKAISCANNLRLQDGRAVVSGHSIFVVDLQDGGGWDWTQGEPPKTNPAYYLRFCKSYSRMGGAMHYTQCDNLQFVHHLYHRLGPA